MKRALLFVLLAALASVSARAEDTPQSRLAVTPITVQVVDKDGPVGGAYLAVRGVAELPKSSVEGIVVIPPPFTLPAFTEVSATGTLPKRTNIANDLQAIRLWSLGYGVDPEDVLALVYADPGTQKLHPLVLAPRVVYFDPAEDVRKVEGAMDAYRDVAAKAEVARNRNRREEDPAFVVRIREEGETAPHGALVVPVTMSSSMGSAGGATRWAVNGVVYSASIRLRYYPDDKNPYIAVRDKGVFGHEAWHVLGAFEHALQRQQPFSNELNLMFASSTNRTGELSAFEMDTLVEMYLRKPKTVWPDTDPDTLITTATTVPHETVYVCGGN